jgi:hypothetical protein
MQPLFQKKTKQTNAANPTISFFNKSSPCLPNSNDGKSNLVVIGPTVLVPGHAQQHGAVWLCAPSLVSLCSADEPDPQT